MELVEALTTEELPSVAIELAALHVAVAARLTAPTASAPAATEDHMVDIEEASRLIGMSRSWLYKSSGLPFRRRIGRKLVFSYLGIQRWLANRPC